MNKIIFLTAVAFLSFSVGVSAEETVRKSVTDRLWEKKVAETVDNHMKTKKCQTLEIEKAELVGITIGSSNDATISKLKTSDCLNEIFEELHGRHGVCQADSSGYGISWDTQCKRSEASIRSALRRANEGRQAAPPAGDFESGPNQK